MPSQRCRWYSAIAIIGINSQAHNISLGYSRVVYHVVKKKVSGDKKHKFEKRNSCSPLSSVMQLLLVGIFLSHLYRIRIVRAMWYWLDPTSGSRRHIVGPPSPWATSATTKEVP